MNNNSDQNINYDPTPKSLALHSWRLFTARPLTFFLLACAAYLPGMIFTYLSMSPGGLPIYSFWAYIILPLALMQIFLAALVCAADSAAGNKIFSFETIMSPVISRLVDLLLILIITALIFWTLNFILGKIFLAVIKPDPSFFIFFRKLLTALLETFFCAALPLCLIKHRGALASLKDSVKLTYQHAMAIFILLAILNLGETLIQSLAGMFAFRAFPPGFHLPSLMVSALFLAFKYVMFTVIYYDLSDWRAKSEFA